MDIPLDKLSFPRTGMGEDASPETVVKDQTYVVLVATGSFNPPTYMHLRMLELAKDALSSEGYCVVGAYMSPVNDAYNKKDLVSSEHRLQMCDLACRSSSFIMVDPWEAYQHSYQRTLTVLDRIRSCLCESGLVSRDSLKVMLVCGSDLIESFNFPGTWIREQVRAICKDYGIVCIRREGKNIDTIISADDILVENKSNIKVVDELVPNQISSTRVSFRCDLQGMYFKRAVGEVSNCRRSDRLYQTTSFLHEYK